MTTLCLRFDVDSHRCLAEGVPALLDVLADAGVPATFFVNMGRLTSRPRMLRRQVAGLSGRGPEPGPDKVVLPLGAKLGRAGIVQVLLANPRVGAPRGQMIRRIAAEGSEVGLHGGRSHRLWQDDGPDWPRERVEAEVDWGLRQLAACGITAPGGFSSPGWAGSPTIDAVLRDRGFRYVVDDHGHGPVQVGRRDGLVRIGTNLLGEPGGVGYLEWLRARGLGDDEVEADFRLRLAGSDGLAVMYDHPFHAGIADLSMLARLVAVALDDGWQFATMGRVAERVGPGGSSDATGPTT